MFQLEKETRMSVRKYMRTGFTQTFDSRGALR